MVVLPINQLYLFGSDNGNVVLCAWKHSKFKGLIMGNCKTTDRRPLS